MTTALAGSGLAFGVSPAAAATQSACDASALGLSLLGSAPINPIEANPASSPCVAASGSLNLNPLSGVAAQAVAASTSVTPGTSAAADAQVTGLDIGLDQFSGALTGPLLSGTNSLLGGINTDLTGAAGTGGLIGNLLAPLKALGLTVTAVDNAQLAASIAPKLPTALDAALPDLVTAGVIRASATAICSDGSATLTGQTQLTDVRVLGTLINANDPAGQVLSVDTSHLTLSQLLTTNDVLKSIKVQSPALSVLGLVTGGGEMSLYDLLVTPGGLLGSVNAILPVGTTLQTILDGLSTQTAGILSGTAVDLPASVLHATVTPHVESNNGDTLTETTLQVNVTALGQPLLSGALAKAHVNVGAAGCSSTPVPPKPTPTTPKPTTPPTTPRPPVVTIEGNVSARYSSAFAQAALQCYDARLRLIDVMPSGNKTLVTGIAERDFVGATASIFLTYGNKKVGTAKVDPDGTFSTRVALPASKIRTTNAARYYAVISGKRTAALKFARRMYTTSVSVKGGKVTYKGRTTTPRAKRQAAVLIQQRVTCTKYKTVARTKPDSKGRFTVSFAAPAGLSSAVYRAQTSVPKFAHSKKPFATYTLPRVLTLK